jgi:hypothetical protein
MSSKSSLSSFDLAADPFFIPIRSPVLIHLIMILIAAVIWALAVSAFAKTSIDVSHGYSYTDTPRTFSATRARQGNDLNP